jgi:hypothetical protein
MGNDMNDEELRQNLFIYIGFLLSSARGLYDEPPIYGSLRLFDATARLINIFEKAGLNDPFLNQLRTEIDSIRFGSMNTGNLKSNLDRLILQYAKELKSQLDLDPS